MSLRRKLMLKAGAYTPTGEAAAVAAWATAVVANGGTVSDARYGLLVRLVERSMAIGHWDATDDIALLTAENAPQALTTLKGRRLMTAVNGPTFTIDRGYAFDGLSNYIDTGFVPSTMARSMGLGNIRAGVYGRTNVASNGSSLGAIGGTAVIMSPRRATGDTALFQIASNADTTTITGITDSRGLMVQSRAGGSTTGNTWRNGAALADVLGLTPTNTVLPSVAFFLGARNVSGAVTGFRATTLGAAEWGAPLPGGTSAELAWYTALQSFMTAIGANV